MTFCKKLTRKHSEHSDTLRMNFIKLSSSAGKPAIRIGVFGVFGVFLCQLFAMKN